MRRRCWHEGPAWCLTKRLLWLNLVAAVGCKAPVPPPPRPEIVSVETSWDPAEPGAARERNYGFDLTLRGQPGLTIQGKPVDDSGIVKVRYENASSSGGRLVLSTNVVQPEPLGQATYDLTIAAFKPYVDAVPTSDGRTTFYCIGKDCWGEADAAELLIHGRDCDKVRVEVAGKPASRVERRNSGECTVHHGFDPELDPKVLAELDLTRAAWLNWQELRVPARLIFEDVTLELTVRSGGWYAARLTELFDELSAGRGSKPAWLARGSAPVVVKFGPRPARDLAGFQTLEGVASIASQVTHVARMSEETTIQQLSCGAYREVRSGTISRPQAFEVRATTVVISDLAGNQVARQVLLPPCPGSINSLHTAASPGGAPMQVRPEQVDGWIKNWVRSVASIWKARRHGVGSG